MSNDEFIPTRASLLSRLKDWENTESWKQFFDTYGPLLYGLARKAGLNDADAQDVVQETVLSVAKQMPGFRYDPSVASFKTWLHTIVRRRISDYFRKAGRQVPVAASMPPTGTGTHPLDRFADPVASILDAVWDEEWEKNLRDAALDRVRRKASPEQFQIFEYLLRGRSPAEVKDDLGVTIARVYLAKHRIGRLVKKELEYLRTKPLE